MTHLVASAFSLGCLGLCALLGFVLAASVPDSPVTRPWNPTQPFALTDQLTPVTPLKLWKVGRNPALCRAALDDPELDVTFQEPLVVSEQCFISNRVTVSKVGQAGLDPVETQCQTALRLALWERHGVRPAAQAFLGQPVAGIEQIGSYNCRPIRGSQRMSTHATAASIDISGFRLADGRVIDLAQDWDSTGPDAEFLRTVRDAACRWFETVLGPDFNALHADHFHLQLRGFGTCR
ncbi:MAG: extensin family protein [Pseudomonadota bacterium]